MFLSNFAVNQDFESTLVILYKSEFDCFASPTCLFFHPVFYILIRLVLICARKICFAGAPVVFYWMKMMHQNYKKNRSYSSNNYERELSTEKILNFQCLITISFFFILARACGVPVGRRSGGQLATT